MDTLDHHFEISIFSKWDNQYWNAAVSWKNKYLRPKWIPDQLTDGWHLSKEIMLDLVCLAVVFSHPNFHPVIELLLCRLCIYLGFQPFYTKIFIK